MNNLDIHSLRGRSRYPGLIDPKAISVPAISLEYSTTPAGNSLTHSVTVPTTTYGLLILCVCGRGGTLPTTASIPAGSMTQLNSSIGGTGGQIAQIYYYINPPSGTYNITVNGTAATDKYLYAQVWEGVNQTTPMTNVPVDKPGGDVNTRWNLYNSDGEDRPILFVMGAYPYGAWSKTAGPTTLTSVLNSWTKMLDYAEVGDYANPADTYFKYNKGGSAITRAVGGRINRIS